MLRRGSDTIRVIFFLVSTPSSSASLSARAGADKPCVSTPLRIQLNATVCGHRSTGCCAPIKVSSSSPCVHNVLQRHPNHHHSLHHRYVHPTIAHLHSYRKCVGAYTLFAPRDFPGGRRGPSAVGNGPTRAPKGPLSGGSGRVLRALKS